jgi:hypothetical protein
LDEIDIGSCILSDNQTTIDVVAKQIWEGNKSLIDILQRIGGFFDKEIANNQCDGIKDILIDWKENNIGTFIFYIPILTITEIQKKIKKRMRSRDVFQKIENYIITQCKKNVPEMLIYNLDDENDELTNIFKIDILREEFEKESEGNAKIYFMGLKYKLNNYKINTYLNNIPIGEKSGIVLGDSEILKHKLEKGFINIYVDNFIDIDFFNTNEFYSENKVVKKKFKKINFSDDRIDIELDKYNSPLIIESKQEKSLIFSTDGSDEIDEEEENYNRDTRNSSPIARDTRVNMDSFFIPKTKGLKSVNLLLLEKDGQNIIAGGQYHSGLTACAVLAELTINLDQENITIKNYSNGKLSFSNYEDDFWRLEEKSSPNSSNYNSGIITEILSSTSSINSTSGLTTEFGGNITIESNLIIKKDEEHTFDINEIEFNDSNVSFDKSGVLIRYSSFCIAKFEKEFALHRTAYRMSDSGTIIDCFVSQPKKGVFEYGGRVYDDSSSILGVVISSQPIYLRQTKQGLEIDATALVARGYIVQISASANKYPLKDKHNAKKILKKNEMKNVEIEVINRTLKKPLIEFSLEFD